MVISFQHLHTCRYKHKTMRRFFLISNVKSQTSFLPLGGSIWKLIEKLMWLCKNNFARSVRFFLNPTNCATRAEHCATTALHAVDRDTNDLIRWRSTPLSSNFTIIFHQRNIIKLITHIWLPASRHMFSRWLYMFAVQERFEFQAFKETHHDGREPSMSNVCCVGQTKIIVNSTEY